MIESFENLGFHHKVKSIETDGNIYEFETGNIFVPEGFEFWFRHGLPVEHDDSNTVGWSQPEGRFSEFFANRVHTGNKSYMYFGFYRIIDAGLTKVIETKPGQTITASIYCHAWSSTDDVPETSDGVDGFAFSKPEGAPGLTDAQRNFTFYIGIDPTGQSASPFDVNIVWSKGQHIYNAFDKIQVSTKAQSNTAKVYIRAKSLWPFKHNDAYIDDLEIILEDNSQECYGTPREQYSRKYYLLPQDATQEELQKVADIAYQTKSTVGFSADDGGIGDLQDKTVVIVWTNPYAWSKDKITEFFELYYPGTQIEHLFLFDKLVLTYPTTHLPAYITQRYSDSHKGLDLRSSWNVWNDELVAAIDGTVTAVGYDDSLPVYGYQIEMVGKHNDDTVYLRYAHLVENGAYVQVGQTVKAGDKIGKPDNTGTSSGDHLHFGVKVNGGYVDPEPLIDWPDDIIPEPPQNELSSKNGIGIHVLQNVDNSLKYNAEGRPRVVKVFSGGDAMAYKQAFPSCKVVFRKYIQNDGWDFVNAGDQHKAANEHLNAYKWEVETYQDYIDYIESANETISHAYEQNLKSISYDVAFAEELAKRGWNVAPCLLNIAIGNPHETQFKDLLPAVEAVCKYNGVVGYHSYWTANETTNWLIDKWQWHAGRWTEMDKVFTANGLYPNYLFTEGGIVYSTMGDDMQYREGWKKCGPFDNYLAQMDIYNKLLDEWNLEHGNRALGVTLFTVGGWDWNAFWIGPGELQMMIDWAKKL